MRMGRTFGWGFVGWATTMLVRKATRRAMYTRSGTPRLPQAARRKNGITPIFLVAAAAGAALAIADVLEDERRRQAEA